MGVKTGGPDVVFRREPEENCRPTLARTAAAAAGSVGGVSPRLVAASKEATVSVVPHHGPRVNRGLAVATDEATRKGANGGRVRYAMTPRVVVEDASLSNTQRRVFECLQAAAFQIRDQGGGWGGEWQPARLRVLTIAERLGLPASTAIGRETSRRRVRRALRVLEERGYLKVLRFGGRGRASAYDTNPAWTKEFARAALEAAGGAEIGEQMTLDEVPVKGDTEQALALQGKGDTEERVSSLEKGTLETPLSGEKGTLETPPLLPDHGLTDHSERPPCARVRESEPERPAESDREPAEHHGLRSELLRRAASVLDLAGVTAEAAGQAFDEGLNAGKAEQELFDAACDWAEAVGRTEDKPAKPNRKWLADFGRWLEGKTRSCIYAVPTRRGPESDKDALQQPAGPYFVGRDQPMRDSQLGPLADAAADGGAPMGAALLRGREGRAEALGR